MGEANATSNMRPMSMTEMTATQSLAVHSRVAEWPDIRDLRWPA
jgi:hypothetical protein